jgi:hypothetical protein
VSYNKNMIWLVELSRRFCSCNIWQVATLVKEPCKMSLQQGVAVAWLLRILSAQLLTGQRTQK